MVIEEVVVVVEEDEEEGKRRGDDGIEFVPGDSVLSPGEHLCLITRP